MNNVQLVGRLTRDVDYRLNGDMAVARFGIAVNRRFKNQQGQYEADFLNCVAFKNTADFISKYFSKGQMIGITGHIQTGSYTNRDGQKVYTTDIIVDTVEFTESKGSSESHNMTNNNTATNDGFMNIPDNMDELPFN